MLEARQLSANLGGRPVVRQINATLRAGELVGVIGANGSGKSTLLQTVAGLLSPESGEVMLNGTPLASHPLRERAKLLAYLPQGAECHWPLSVEQVVRLGRLPFGDEAAEPVERALKAVDVLHLREREITELSGGERARVFLARALAGDPAFLLIDEPGAGLDPYHQLQLMELLSARAKEGCAILVVLHDLGLAARFCHRLLLLDEGRLLASGTPEEVLRDKPLAQAHGIAVYRARHEEQPVLLPWRRIR